MIYLAHNNKLIKIRSGINAGKLIQKGSGPEPPAPHSDETTIYGQTWMTKNLAIDDGQGGITTRTVNYGKGDVVEYYYTQEAAARVAGSVEGWHLPTGAEWTTLIYAVGDHGDDSWSGTKLKSTYGWSSENGVDVYRFAAFPAGYYSDTGTFYGFGTDAQFWSSTAASGDNTYFISFTNSTDALIMGANKLSSKSVRLIKDQP